MARPSLIGYRRRPGDWAKISWHILACPSRPPHAPQSDKLPTPGDCEADTVAPLEFIDHLAALILPSRLHRHPCHDVLAPNAPLRLAATAYGRDAVLTPPPPPEVSPPPATAPRGRSPAHYLWAILLARPFASLSLVCPNCDADMRIRAFITEPPRMRRILNHIREPAEPPRIAAARAPPAWEDPASEAAPDWNVLAQPQPVYVFDQRG